MPQMAPYNWLILFLLFNMIMMFIISFNHYHSMNNFNQPKNFTKSMKSFYWKW